jgi:hypothetical protein
MSDLVLPHATAARCNWGRWIIDCRRCTSALEIKDDRQAITRPDGRIVVHPHWGDQTMQCWDCGWVADGVAYPPDPIGIEVILRMRPDEKHRNWQPGETLDWLMLENIAHGIMPPTEGIEGGGPMMITRGDVIVGGSIVTLIPELEATRRLFEIGP